MTAVAPVRERNQPNTDTDTSTVAREVIGGLMKSIEKTQQAARANAAKILRNTADRLETIAGDQDKITRLIASLAKIKNRRTREAALEALGFDYETSVGFGLRIANKWKIFKDGQAVMHKRKPVTMGEAKGTLLYRALQLRKMARVFEGSTLGDAVENRRAFSNFTRLVGEGVNVAWDFMSYSNEVLGPLGGIALAAASETENDIRWEFEKLIALTPAMTINDLETARAAYTKQYALIRIGAIASPIPLSGTLTTLLGSLTGDGRAEMSTDLSLHELIEEASRS